MSPLEDISKRLKKAIEQKANSIGIMEKKEFTETDWILFEKLFNAEGEGFYSIEIEGKSYTVTIGF